MKVISSSAARIALPLLLIVLGIALGGVGIYVGDTDDAPGAALIGIVLMITAISIGARKARRQA